MNRSSLILVASVTSLCASLFLTGTSPQMASAAGKPDASRYPYDPACAWGRLADGRGMLVRCLSHGEAQQLIAETLPAPAQGNPAAKATPAEDEGNETPAEEPKKPARAKAAVLPAVADQGKLPKAHRLLGSARSRFEQCVNQHGGLTSDTGAEVHVRFLVRERGRAEGVSVSKRSGVGARAAQCVADVVDRRRVGVPDVPMVGATIVISFTPEN